MQSKPQEEANYIGKQGKQGNCGHYNQGWKPHPTMGQVEPSNRPFQQQ